MMTVPPNLSLAAYRTKIRFTEFNSWGIVAVAESSSDWQPRAPAQVAALASVR